MVIMIDRWSVEIPQNVLHFVYPRVPCQYGIEIYVTLMNFGIKVLKLAAKSRFIFVMVKNPAVAFAAQNAVKVAFEFTTGSQLMIDFRVLKFY